MTVTGGRPGDGLRDARLTDALLSGASSAEISRSPLPADYVAAHLRLEDIHLFRDGGDKDVRRSLHVGRVAMPELAPDEVLVAVMASSINYNTVWSAMFEPIPTFRFLEQFARQGGWAARHNLPYQVVGSDGAGVIARVGSGVRRWQPGDRVVISPAYVDDQEPGTHADGMLGAEQRAWGFETNFGGLAEFAVVRASQLMPKPAHLTWEEAACFPLCGGTAYRMLVSDNGARMKQGDVVLIWGASGGLGSYATQFALNGGAVPVCVVSSPQKAEICRAMGAELIIDRSAEDYRFWSDETTQNPKEWQRLGARIRELTGGEDPDIVFEHPGRETFGASVYVARRGGTIVTCASTSGFMHEYDNRYLWMNLKRIIGSHFANYREAWEANRLVQKGRIHPTLSRSYPLAEAGQAAFDVHRNLHQGKVGVLCLAPEEGLGVRDSALRERHRSAIERFRNV
jgi:crotonyl-CoA reductase